MIMNFITKDFSEDFAAIYVNSAVLMSEQYECDDESSNLCINVVENKLLYNINFSDIIKALLSFFIYGEGDYYAPYRRVYVCSIDPRKSTDVIIENIKGEISFKNSDGKVLDSKKTVVCCKKKIVQYAFLSVFRLVYVISLFLFASVKAVGMPAFNGTVLFYICMILAVSAVVYTFYDVLSVLIRSIKYYRQEKTII